MLTTYFLVFHGSLNKTIITIPPFELTVRAKKLGVARWKYSYRMSWKYWVIFQQNIDVTWNKKICSLFGTFLLLLFMTWTCTHCKISSKKEKNIFFTRQNHHVSKWFNFEWRTQKRHYISFSLRKYSNLNCNTEYLNKNVIFQFISGK